MLGYRMTN